jgi:hypothetical protein
LTEIGTPDPVNPEIDVIPRVVPVPGPVEVPDTTPAEPVREPDKVPA